MSTLRSVGGAVRLVLGFDAACVRCSRVAAVARDGAQGRLEVMALADTQMQTWLSGAGSGVQGGPVLVRIAGDDVAVFSGRIGLPLALVGHVGPRAALGILSALASRSAEHVRGAGSTSARSLSRRTMVGGALGAVGLAGSAAVIGVPATASPAVGARRYTPMSGPMAAGELASLQRAPAITAAGGTLGRPDWSNVHRGWSARQNRVLYTVAFDHQDLGPTHLVTGGSVGDDMAIAFRPATRARNGAPLLQTYRPDGRPLVSVALTENGVDTSQPVTASPEVFSTPSSGVEFVTSAPTGPKKAFIDCFIICLNANSAGDAAMPCISCLNAGSPTEATIYCAQCYALAGDAFGQCSRECAGFM